MQSCPWPRKQACGSPRIPTIRLLPAFRQHLLETKRDEYFDYYRGYHAFWKLYGMELPDEVLKKLYYQNALRVTPGLPQTGWPR
mgnify:CR=1 FL=1